MTKRTGTMAVALGAFMLGGVASQFMPRLYAQDAAAVKGPKWLYGLSARIRAGNEADFTKDTKKYGFEVYQDQNNGNLIYLSETGAIAVVAGK